MGLFRKSSLMISSRFRIIVILGFILLILHILHNRDSKHLLFNPRALCKSNMGIFTSDTSFPHQHVLYIKTHKTGSTTMTSILAEYSRTHDLLPLLPSNYHISQSKEFTDKKLKLIPGVQKYDMVFNHVIYTPKLLNYMYDDAYRVTTLREPFDNFISAFYYYKYQWFKAYLADLPDEDPVTPFLQNPYKHEGDPSISFTNNRQSIDLGYDMANKKFTDVKYIKTFIKQTSSRFDLVMIMEYFDEGLIMMKRALRWSTEDILYLRQNHGLVYSRNKKAKNNPALEAEQKRLYKKFARADVMLYRYFLRVFKDKMAKEIGLDEEVAEYKSILRKFQGFCDEVSEFDPSENLIIPEGRWNNGFRVTPFKCKWLTKDATAITNHLLSKQRLYHDEKYLVSKLILKLDNQVNHRLKKMADKH